MTGATGVTGARSPGPAGLKVAVVGGGSTYTPELVDGLLRRSVDLPVDVLTLVDPSAERLEVVGGFVRRMCEAAGSTISVQTTADLRAGVREAAFVVSQFRVGGQHARHGDELLGRRWGLVGQETTGIGGLAKALRTIPVALAVQAAVAELAAPGAWLVNFTNPAGLVTEALLAHGVGDPPRVVGLCNYPWRLRLDLARDLGVDPADLALDYVGLNHLSWVRDVAVGSTSHLAEALEGERGRWAAEGADAPFSARLLDDLGLVLNPYLQYYYETSRILQRQRTTPTRAEAVMAVEDALLARYRDPGLAYSADLLSGRGGAYYSESAAALMADLAAQRPGVHVVNVRNDGAIPGLPPDVVVETSCRVGPQGPKPLPTRPLDRPIQGLVSQVKDYERYAVDAALSGDLRAARLALLVHPLGPDSVQVPTVLDDLLTTNRDLLPTFR